MGSSTRGAEASFAFPLKIRAGRGFTVRDLPERARPRAQQRDRARCNRIEQRAQQLGHCSGRGRPHSAVIALGSIPNKVQVGDRRGIRLRRPATPSPLPLGEAFPPEAWPFPLETSENTVLYSKASEKTLAQFNRSKLHRSKCGAFTSTPYQVPKPPSRIGPNP